MRVPFPGRALTRSAPPKWATRSRMLTRPSPVDGDGVRKYACASKPRPSSSISRSTASGSRVSRTSTWLAAACLTTLARASWKTPKSSSCTAGVKRIPGSEHPTRTSSPEVSRYFSAIDSIRDGSEVVEHGRVEEGRHLPHAVHHVEDLVADVVHGAVQRGRLRREPAIG